MTKMEQVSNVQTYFLCAQTHGSLINGTLSPEEKMFSWYSIVGSGFRIDHVFAKPSADCKIEGIYYDPTPRETEITVHSAMMVEYSENHD